MCSAGSVWHCWTARRAEMGAGCWSLTVEKDEHMGNPWKTVVCGSMKSMKSVKSIWMILNGDFDISDSICWRVTPCFAAMLQQCWQAYNHSCTLVAVVAACFYFLFYPIMFVDLRPQLLAPSDDPSSWACDACGTWFILAHDSSWHFEDLVHTVPMYIDSLVKDKNAFRSNHFPRFAFSSMSTSLTYSEAGFFPFKHLSRRSWLSSVTRKAGDMHVTATANFL